LIGACFGLDDLNRPFHDQAEEIIHREDLPPALLNAAMPIEILLQRNPSLKPHMMAIGSVMQGSQNAPPDDEGNAPADAPEPVSPIEPAAIDTTRTLVYSKVLLNVFGPNTRSPQCTAQQYTQWLKDVQALEQCLGFLPGALHGSGSGGGGGTGGGNPVAGGGPGGGAGGNRELIDDAQLRAELQAMESDLIQRMDLLEVLSDDNLARCITPTAAVVEQLMHLKTKLSGKALVHARTLIRKYVDQLAEVLRKQVISTSTGKIDHSVPPKKTFRNLDLRRTIWKNLPNYNKHDGRLYVDQLYYRHTAQKELNTYLIVVVDQSGSMVDAMTQCAILASIFAKLPRVKVTLIAFDTSVVDLTQWVEDPFESLMRTNLGGGNDGPLAMVEARAHILDPRRTTMVWISDFYERRELMPMIAAVKQSGVHFLPVASVSGTGHYSMDGWFKDELKKIGCPVLTGNIKKLIVELKKQLR
ncbi:MAG: VWA domain-containing protein, partial [Verrucomicrobiota bacterium]